MVRQIRRGIVTTLAMAVLLVPAVGAQTDADKKNLQSAFERAYELQKQGKMAKRLMNMSRHWFWPGGPSLRRQPQPIVMHNLAILYRDAPLH